MRIILTFGTAKYEIKARKKKNKKEHSNKI